MKSCLRGQGHSQNLTSSCLKSTLTFCHLSEVSWMQVHPAVCAGGLWGPRREASFWERCKGPLSFPRKSPLAKASHVVWGSISGILVFCSLKFLRIKERSSFSISIKFISLVFGWNRVTWTQDSGADNSQGRNCQRSLSVGQVRAQTGFQRGRQQRVANSTCPHVLTSKIQKYFRIAYMIEPCLSMPNSCFLSADTFPWTCLSVLTTCMWHRLHHPWLVK